MVQFKLATSSSNGLVVTDKAIIHDTIKKNFNRRTNCFITGPAGTGKSFIVDQLMKNTETVVTLTASTGIAAMNIGGVTVHSWSGINTKAHPKMLEKVVKKNPRWQYILNRLLTTKVLVIDEVGMLKAGQMDLIDMVCRYAHFGNGYKDAPPFGGIQVICTGDFMQLPPVGKGNEDRTNYLWPFESKVWQDGAFRTFALSKIYRQENEDFCRVLNKVRLGIVDKEVIEMLDSRAGLEIPEDIVPMRFVGTNEKVRIGNLQELEKAEGELHGFQAKVTVDQRFHKFIDSVVQEAASCTRMETDLQVKVGMPVIMLVNRGTLDEYFMNGSLGTFVGTDQYGEPRVKIHKTGETFTVSKHIDELKTGDGMVKATVAQYPFRLAHYSTYHKSQGLTLEYAEVDMSRLFADGQAYTGLSRVKTLDGLFIKNFNVRGIRANKKALRFYQVGK